MSWFYRQVIRRALFHQDSESVHDLTLKALATVAHSPFLLNVLASFYGAEPRPLRLWGLDFPNPIGLAAGMDKRAVALPAWAAMGFGFCELGGVTWHSQSGNPRPRMFRATRTEALINRMGFNNDGAEAFAATLRGWHNSGLWPKHPVGVNLGKSKITPLDEAGQDYAQSLNLLWPLADFFVVNVSSPNTPNLRQLQDKSALDEVLDAVQTVNQKHAAASSTAAKPILVKVAPDLSFEALDEILELTESRNLAGIVATNTTIARPPTTDLRTRRIYEQTGGLSGRPLRDRSTEVIKHLAKNTHGKLPIIGVGGVFSATDAMEKFAAGASLVQIYSGLVYQGPSLIQEIVTGLDSSEREVYY